MTTQKYTSADAYEFIRARNIPWPEVEDGPTFGRQEVQWVLDEMAVFRGPMPSAKSFLDWARRENLVEAVEGERGRYRWAQTAESEAADIGRQMAQEIVTDMDPANPMYEDEEHDRYVDPHPQPTFDPINEAHILLGTKRIPRKSKKRMKSAILKGGGVHKVTVHCTKTSAEAWEMSR